MNLFSLNILLRWGWLFNLFKNSKKFYFPT